MVGGAAPGRVRSWSGDGCGVVFSSHSSLISLRAQVKIININNNNNNNNNNNSFGAEYIQTIRIAMRKSIGSQSSQAKGQNDLFQVHAECLGVLLSDKERNKEQRLMGT